MSWEESFYLPTPVATLQPDEVASRVRTMVPSSAIVRAAYTDALMSIAVRFDRELVDEVAVMVGSSARRWLDYNSA